MTSIVKLSEGRSTSVSFRDAGAVALTRRVPIIESLKDSRSIIGEEFRLLRAKLQEIRQKRPLGCIALVSALPGEGKSTIALGLATALAREPGKRILLVECDLRRPSISLDLGLPPHPGLAEWLNGAVDHVPIRLVEPARFYLVCAGKAALERPESVGSPRMEALLNSACEHFDLVIVDATPILPVADTVLLQDLVDGFLLVVRSRMTPRGAIQEALGRLRADKVIGVVLNDHREYRDSYMSYAYHGYGMSEGSRSSSGRGSRSSRRSSGRSS
jgi:capsular exopolysaccharide synthesis family protein